MSKSIFSLALSIMLFITLLVLGVQNGQAVILKAFGYQVSLPAYLFAIITLFLGFLSGKMSRK